MSTFISVCLCIFTKVAVVTGQLGSNSVGRCAPNSIQPPGQQNIQPPASNETGTNNANHPNPNPPSNAPRRNLSAKNPRQVTAQKKNGVENSDSSSSSIHGITTPNGPTNSARLHGGNRNPIPNVPQSGRVANNTSKSGSSDEDGILFFLNPGSPSDKMFLTKRPAGPKNKLVTRSFLLSLTDCQISSISGKHDSTKTELVSGGSNPLSGLASWFGTEQTTRNNSGTQSRKHSGKGGRRYLNLSRYQPGVNMANNSSGSAQGNISAPSTNTGMFGSNGGGSNGVFGTSQNGFAKTPHAPQLNAGSKSLGESTGNGGSGGAGFDALFLFFNSASFLEQKSKTEFIMIYLKLYFSLMHRCTST